MKRKPGSRGKSKLSDDDLIKLKKLIKEQNLTGIRQIKKLIHDEFDVTYSERQISRIMNKLNFGLCKTLCYTC